MNNILICQSCGMPLDSDNLKGTTGCGCMSDDYCVYCYKEGKFTKDMTMDEMIESNIQYLDEWVKSTGKNMTEEEARKQLKEYLPTLKRWKS